ncbi:AraC family transcriptional regulator ligand-binding domain-containing protein [Chitinophaga lutea]
MSAQQFLRPMIESSTITFEGVKVILYHLRKAGVDTTALMTAARIDPACLNIHKHHVAPEALSRIFRQAVQQTGDQHIGLHFGDESNLDALGIVGQLYRYSPDVFSGSRRISEYLPLLHSAFRYSTETDDRHFRIILEPYPHTAASAFGMRQFVELTMAFNRHGIRHSLQRDVNPIAATLTYPIPKSELPVYERVLQCPVTGGAERTTLTYDIADVSGPHPFDNPPLLAGLEAFAAAELARIRQRGAYCLTAKNCVIGALSEGETPNVHVIAARIGISAPLLRRRMAEEGSSFREVLDEVRREIAGMDAGVTSPSISTESALSKALDSARELERSRIARELHDGVSGLLAAAKMHFSRLLPAGDESHQYAVALSLLDDASREVRKTAHQLMPEILLEYGLDEALRRYCQTIGPLGNIRITYDRTGNPHRYEPAFELAVYRMAQELIHNAIKHAAPANVRVFLSLSRDWLQLDIDDDGKGFDPAETPTGLGLDIMRKRVAEWNGEIAWTSAPQLGTQVRAQFSTHTYHNR